MDGSATSQFGADYRTGEPTGELPVVGASDGQPSDPPADPAIAATLREPTGGFPRIGDYWPDSATAYTAADDSGHYPVDLSATRVFAPPPPPRRPWLRVLLGALGALVFLGGSMLTLARLVSDRDDDSSAAVAPAPQPGDIAEGVPSPPVSIEPAPSTTAAPTSAPATSASTAAELPFNSGTFELEGDVIELNLTVADLGNDALRVSTPDGSGLDPKTTIDGDDVKLQARADGNDDGSGRLDVRLNSKIAWSLRMTGGMRNAVFALAGADIERIDVRGGAARMVMALPVQKDSIPIRMSGGVNTWVITTGREVPVKAVLRKGGGEVVLNGKRLKGVDKNTTIRVKADDSNADGLEIDAIAGLGSLTVNPASGSA